MTLHPFFFVVTAFFFAPSSAHGENCTGANPHASCKKTSPAEQMVNPSRSDARYQSLKLAISEISDKADQPHTDGEPHTDGQPHTGAAPHAEGQPHGGGSVGTAAAQTLMKTFSGSGGGVRKNVHGPGSEGLTPHGAGDGRMEAGGEGHKEGLPYGQLLQRLDEDRKAELKACGKKARCPERVEAYYAKAIAAIATDRERNFGIDEEALRLARELIRADVEADGLAWRLRRDPRNPQLQAQAREAQQRVEDLMLKLHPHNGVAESPFHLAIHQEVYRERLGSGRQAAEDAVRYGGRFPGTHTNLGDELMRDGDPRAALEAFRKALALDPKYSKALTGMGAAKFALGDIQGAYDDAVRALQLDPNDAAAFATMKLAEGRGAQPGGVDGSASGGGSNEAGGSGSGGAGFGGGRADVNSLLTQLPPGAADARRYNEKAASALRVGDHAAALDAAEKALKAYSANPYPHLVRARVYSDQSAWTKALGSALDGLRVAPKDKSLLRARAYAANRSGDRLAAMEAANALLEADQGAYAMANLAYARGLNGDKSGMIDALERARDLDPAFQASLDSALQMPADADMMFLFPGESPSERTLEALKKAGKLPGKKGRFGLLALGSLAGGILIALGLLSSFVGPAVTKIQSVFTGRRSPAVTAMRSHDRELLATIEPPSAAGHIPGTLRGQYKIVRQIGMGGMGMVFEGEDVTLGRRVAIKKMRDEIRLDRRERARFVNEAKTVASLHHANIVDIYAIVEENDDVYLVFEYVTGRTVHELIGQKGALPWREAMGIFRGMAAALDFAHQRNIVHRDLKPSNVMIDDEGYVKVMDFGIARAAKDVATRVSVMMTNTIVGTPPYMAPEQEQGVVRKESDVYALAICLYEMLTGKMPFVGTGGGMLLNKINMSYVKASAMVDGLPNGIDEVFEKALQADPDKRYRSARELVSALNDLAPASRPDAAPPQVRNLPGETA